MNRTFHGIADRLRRLGRPASLIICLSLAPCVTVAAEGAANRDRDVPTQDVSGPTVEATVHAGRLMLKAEGAPLAEVLRAIGEAGAFGLVLRGEFAEPIYRSFTDEPLEDAIRELVGTHFLILVHAGPTPDQAETGLVGIRVTANQARGSLKAADAKLSPAEPDVPPDEDASDPIDQQEAYRQAVLDYVPPTKDDLLSELDGTEQAARVAAMPKVGSLAPREAIEVISYVFAKDDDATVRSRAVAALTRLDGAGARVLLRERALGDDDAGLRMQALNALASSRGERAVNVIGQALRQDPEPKVRMSALRALGRMGGDWARRSLERATRDRDPEISLAAEEALAAWPED